MRFMKDPYKQDQAALASRRQDMTILTAIQGRNSNAKRAESAAISESIRLTREGIARREYYGFVSGLSEYLTL